MLHTVLGVLSVKVFALFETGDFSNMSLFGGVFFMPLFYWGVAKLAKQKAADVFDVFTICLVFTLMCARLNCIVSGCCLGAHIPIEGLTHLRFPTRELELLFYVLLLSRLWRKVLSGSARGMIYPIYMIAYGIFRFVTETLRFSDRTGPCTCTFPTSGRCVAGDRHQHLRRIAKEREKNRRKTEWLNGSAGALCRCS